MANLVIPFLLAAGESRRMGRAKALLPAGASTFSRSIVTALRRGGAGDVSVVVGHNPGPIVAHLADLTVRFIYNPHHLLGQLSSIQVAIRAFPLAEGALFALVDQPGLQAATVRHMLTAFRAHPSRIIVAAYKGHRGHPVIFPHRLFKDLLAAPLDQGARVVVQRHLADRIQVETFDPAVIRDIDRPEQYRRWIRSGRKAV